MKTFVLFLSIITINAYADEPEIDAKKTCFDFSKKTIKILKENLKEGSGAIEELKFASANELIDRPISELYQKLLDPKTIRDSKVVVTEKKQNDFLKLLEEKITIKPVFFLSISWTEVWAYALKSGTETNPESIVISYEKTEGTSHLKHLCGNIVLTKSSDKQTKVYLYEEVIAERRSSEDILNGLKGTLRTLKQ